MNINNLKDIDHFENYIKRLSISKKNHIFRGAAGSGKTTLIQLIKRRMKKNLAVLAFTGVAAGNAGGSTIHSFFSFPSRIINPDLDLDIPKDKRDVIIALELLIIDECSMVSAYLLDAIDSALKKIRKIDSPFGGVQLVLVGDHMQLPPVIDKTGIEVLESIYKDSLHFFSAKSYNHNDFEIETLTKVYRQNDPELIEYLNKIRVGNFNNKDLKDFNDLVAEKTPDSNEIITLTFTNKEAEILNKKKLDDINSEKYIYSYEESGASVKCTAEKNLELKVGARVMMLTNQKFWNNGTLGTISRLNKNAIWVKIKGTEYEVEKHKWEKFSYRLKDKNKPKGINNIISKVVGTFIQFPLKLAWSVTVHKSQGQTFEKMILDTGRGSFAHGQTYSALSRVKNIHGLYLKKKLTIKDFVYDKQIMNYHFKEQDYVIEAPFTT